MFWYYNYWIEMCWALVKKPQGNLHCTYLLIFSKKEFKTFAFKCSLRIVVRGLHVHVDVVINCVKSHRLSIHCQSEQGYQCQKQTYQQITDDKVLIGLITHKNTLTKKDQILLILIRSIILMFLLSKMGACFLITGCSTDSSCSQGL